MQAGHELKFYFKIHGGRYSTAKLLDNDTLAGCLCL